VGAGSARGDHYVFTGGRAFRGHSVPWDVFGLLPEDGEGLRRWPTKEAALEALSGACLRWARKSQPRVEG
jgi:hypothetical protein